MSDDKLTGLRWVDELSPEDRKKVIANFKTVHASLNDEQRKSSLESYYRVIRERRKNEPLLTSGKSDREVILEVLNGNNPYTLLQNAIDEATRNGRLDIAEDLKKRRPGFELCHISLYDEDDGKEIL